jgi:hypothetical protein
MNQTITQLGVSHEARGLRFMYFKPNIILVPLCGPKLSPRYFRLPVA